MSASYGTVPEAFTLLIQICIVQVSTPFVLLSTSVRTISHTRFELLGMALFGCVQVSTPFVLLSTSVRISFHTPFELLGMALCGCV